MSFYDPTSDEGGFAINFDETTELIEQFHRTIVDRRNPIDWSEFDASKYDRDLLEEARNQWAGRAVAEYQSTAQFAQLLHRLTLINAPVSMIGAATRLAQDECRHAELCARFAQALGGHDDKKVADGLELFPQVEDIVESVYLTILVVCCFGETLSVPILRSLYTVATDPVAERVAQIIANDEEYHSRFGWEALTYFTPQLTAEQRQRIEARLPVVMGHFEKVCFGSPTIAADLVGKDLVIEPGETNLGTLTRPQYAVMFYHAMSESILPQLTELGFDAVDLWQRRLVPET